MTTADSVHISCGTVHSEIPSQRSALTKSKLVQVGEHNKHGRVLKAEKMAARTAIYPILQAEEDRR